MSADDPTRTAESGRLLMEMAGYARALRAAGGDPARLMEAYGDRLIALTDGTYRPTKEADDA